MKNAHLKPNARVGSATEAHRRPRMAIGLTLAAVFSLGAATMTGTAAANDATSETKGPFGLPAAVLAAQADRSNWFGIPAASAEDRDARIQVAQRVRRASELRRILRQDGYRDIRITDRQLPVYVAQACRDDDRFELRMDRFGSVRGRRRIGACRQARRAAARLTPREARRILQRLGYAQISFTEIAGPSLQAEACERGQRYRLTVTPRGDISFRERIGRCLLRGQNKVAAGFQDEENQSGLTPSQVRNRLRVRGFNRIRFIDDTLPLYVVEACRRDRRFRIKLNRRGKVREREGIGRCNLDTREGALTVAQVRDLLEAREYYNVRVTDRNLPRYEANACRRGRDFELVLSRFGDIRRRTVRGRCARPLPRALRVAATQRRAEEFDINVVRRLGRIDPDECQDILEQLLDGETINFDTGSARINSESFSLLEQLAFVAQRCPSSNIEIAGHTDSVGSAESNQILSERRARSVVRFLTNRGVPGSRLTGVGYGEELPIASNDSSSGRAANRRIEFIGSWTDV